MTPRQRDCLNFIIDYETKHDGVTPSYDEIAKHLGVKSKSAVSMVIKQLERLGRVRRHKRAARGLVVLYPESSLHHVGDVARNVMIVSALKSLTQSAETIDENRISVSADAIGRIEQVLDALQSADNDEHRLAG